MQCFGWKANLTRNILPVSPGLTVVMKPLWVLTGSVTGAVVSTGSTVVFTTGMVVVTGGFVVAGRVGSAVGWYATVVAGRVGRVVGRCTTGVVSTVGSGIVGQGPFNLYCPPTGNGPLTLGWWATGGYRPLCMW